jgi:predicted nucleic acid-binding Zn ribbon protein
MPTYVYEVICEDALQKPRRFEARQSMKDPALTHDPESGLPVRRVMDANINFCAPDKTRAAGGDCGSGCACC